MDKDIALVLAEMLIKQDETTEQIKETNGILRDFMGMSIKQWEQQQHFNEMFATELKEIKGDVSTIKKDVSALVQLESRVKAMEEREAKFEMRLANIERLLKAS
jgi:hypothetical protein